MCIGHSSCSVGICFGNELCSVGLGFFDNLCLNKLCLSNDLVVLKVTFGIDLINESLGLGIPFTLNSSVLSFDCFNFFLLAHLRKLGPLVFVLSFLSLYLSGLDLLFLIIEDSLIECKLLSLKSVFELENGLLLHGFSN